MAFPVLLLALTFFGYQAEIPKSEILGPVFASAHSNQPVIAITFDDGPSPSTPQVLEILKRYHVKATFFLIGQNIERHPDIPAQIVAGGNAIGNHTYSHSWWTSIDFPKQLSHEIDKTSGLIQATAHVTPTLFRPPRGLRNPWMIRLAKRKGYTVITWSIEVYDWENPKPSPEVIAQRVLSQVKPGAIILLHDGLGTRINPQVQNMVAALPTIIESLQAQGYRFVTIPELLQINRAKVSESLILKTINQLVIFLNRILQHLNWVRSLALPSPLAWQLLHP
jgi:peptidoglycan-N-acetylglucosamine deacetylase